MYSADMDEVFAELIWPHAIVRDARTADLIAPVFAGGLRGDVRL